MEPISELGNATLFAVCLKSPIASLEETPAGVLRQNTPISLENQVENDQVEDSFHHC